MSYETLINTNLNERQTFFANDCSNNVLKNYFVTIKIFKARLLIEPSKYNKSIAFQIFLKWARDCDSSEQSNITVVPEKNRQK